ncbi:MAG: hypothetical protein ABR534_08380 [Desulfotignum sp.]
MKFVVFGALVFLLAGCNIYQASPGPVLKNSPDQSGHNRIVTFTVTGKGVEPEAALTRGQARLMAERAAVADGYRQFVEKLQGVYVEAFSAAGYGTIDEDTLKTSTRAVLRGVEIKEISHGDFGIARAVMELRIHFTRHGMIWWPEGLGRDLGWYETAANTKPGR